MGKEAKVGGASLVVKLATYVKATKLAVANRQGYWCVQAIDCIVCVHSSLTCKLYHDLFTPTGQNTPPFGGSTKPKETQKHICCRFYFEYCYIIVTTFFKLRLLIKRSLCIIKVKICFVLS